MSSGSKMQLYSVSINPVMVWCGNMYPGGYKLHGGEHFLLFTLSSRRSDRIMGLSRQKMYYYYMLSDRYTMKLGNADSQFSYMVHVALILSAYLIQVRAFLFYHASLTPSFSTVKYIDQQDFIDWIVGSSRSSTRDTFSTVQ